LSAVPSPVDPARLGKATMISTNDVRPGMALQLSDGLFNIVEYQHVKPGKGKAFVRMKIKNLETGQVLERTFRDS